MELKELVQEIIDNSHSDVAVVVKSFKDNSTFMINEYMVFPSASTIKLLIMARIMKEVKEKKRNLEDKIILKDVYKCGGDGILKELNDGHIFTLKEVITLMIIVSDNTATNILIDMIGMDNINCMGKELGLTNTELRRKMMDSEAVKMGRENVTTAKDLSCILEMIYNRQLVDCEYSDIMLDILKKQQVTGRLDLYLPEDILIAHKTGDLDNLEHDVGIVYHPRGNYLICVLTKNVSTNKYGREIIGEISQKVYNNINR
ncbi:serine hydrolase [Clostridium cochlearium]|uniref:serine hydrolase n=2 Tax=Clostridium TaxID=1485 RepID=UPI001EE03CE3|nr:serine hydrolase [Clostridium cochlearium]MBV1821139.1 class A beta-lactamase-related serine hydrolase [Bacteroidales bacterium MSK.15.36]MCG4578612.1 class A beta-lactamase-related serine hydrolase [Clostridium cochlearium]